MQKIRIVLPVLLFQILILAACSSAPAATATPTSSATVTKTLTPTSSATVTKTLTPTGTPTPAFPASCSDLESVQAVVDAFLTAAGFDSYASFLETLPGLPELCSSDDLTECDYYRDNFGHFKYYQRAYLPTVLLGSFDVRYSPQSRWGTSQTCLLFAQKDLPNPIPVLGAIQTYGYYTVVIDKFNCLYTQAMTREKFDEWVQLHKGSFMYLGIVLHFYDDATYESLQIDPQHPYKLSYFRPNVLEDIVENSDSYTREYASPWYMPEDIGDLYQYINETIADILTTYDVLFPTELRVVDWLPKIAYYAEHPYSYPPIGTDEYIVYGDSLAVNTEVNISEEATYALDDPHAYSGSNAIRLETQGNYIYFSFVFGNHPVNLLNYDSLLFYLHTSESRYSVAVTGRYDNVWSSGVSFAYSTHCPFCEILLQNSQEYVAPVYTWLGLLPPLSAESPEGWRLIRIPVSTLDQDQNGNIYGLIFEFFSSFGEVLLDEIRFVSED